ncbi:MAG: Rieske 2Fe-2S domain-containing protein [Planctomycetota bacterium]|nr:Rieske 2Fe-2S domain-containing protein [Planctomycetota bacterium]
MIGRILGGLFRGKPTIIEGTAALEEGTARRVEIGDTLAGTGVELILCRVDGEVSALDARCPHEGGRIVPGPLVEGRYALCPLHNYRFEPATGKARDVICRKARTYRVRESGDACEVWL